MKETTPRSLPSLHRSRVLFFSVSYRPEHSGIGPYSAAVAERLAREGADVSVVAGFPHYPSWRIHASDRWRMKREDTIGGVPVTRLRQVVPRRHTGTSRALYEISFFAHGLITRLTWQETDVVVAVTPSFSGALLAYLTARRQKLPLVLIVQDLVTAAAQQSGLKGGRLLATLLGRLEGHVLRNAQAVGLVHDSFLRRCLDMGVSAERLHVVPNWSLHDRSPVEDTRAMPGWEGRFVILHAGNMGHKQGLEIVVDAARLAHEMGEHDLLFVLMGDGNRRDTLAEMISDLPTISMMDPVSDEAFPSVLAAADLLLIAQRREVYDMSLPSKLTSYFTAGRPIVCSASLEGGTATEIRRSGAGILVPPQDAEALLTAVLQLKVSPAVAQALGAAGGAYSRQHLLPEDALDRVVALVCAGMKASA